MKTRVKVEVDVEVDLDEMPLPMDRDGILIWTPIQCIEDMISHSLFKEHDASYMGDLFDSASFEGWNLKVPLEVLIWMAEVMAENLWSHPESKGGARLHERCDNLEEAKGALTEDAIKIYLPLLIDEDSRKKGIEFLRSRGVTQEQIDLLTKTPEELEELMKKEEE